MLIWKFHQLIDSSRLSLYRRVCQFSTTLTTVNVKLDDFVRGISNCDSFEQVDSHEILFGVSVIYSPTPRVFRHVYFNLIRKNELNSRCEISHVFVQYDLYKTRIVFLDILFYPFFFFSNLAAVAMRNKKQITYGPYEMRFLSWSQNDNITRNTKW